MVSLLDAAGLAVGKWRRCQALFELLPGSNLLFLVLILLTLKPLSFLNVHHILLKYENGHEISLGRECMLPGHWQSGLMKIFLISLSS